MSVYLYGVAAERRIVPLPAGATAALAVPVTRATTAGDGVHPNEAGHVTLAADWFAAFDEVLGRPRTLDRRVEPGLG